MCVGLATKIIGIIQIIIVLGNIIDLTLSSRIISLS